MSKISIIICFLSAVILACPPLEAQQADTNDSSSTAVTKQPPSPVEDLPLAPLNTEGIPQKDKESPEKENRGELETMPLSKTVVRHNPEPEKLKLTISPEVFIGGTFSNYRGLGYFAFFDFGGGVGFTFDETWLFKLSVLALSETHRFTPKQDPPSTTTLPIEEDHDVWFIQPTAYVMYNFAQFPDYHYWVPMDLFVGIKLGANIFRTDKAFYNVKDENDFLWGFAMTTRFYLYDRFGISGNLELSTIDYFRNFFFHYGMGIFWDFEVLGKEYED